MDLVLVVLALAGGILIGIAVGRRWRENDEAHAWIEGFKAHAETLTYGQPDPSDSAGA